MAFEQGVHGRLCFLSVLPRGVAKRFLQGLINNLVGNIVGRVRLFFQRFLAHAGQRAGGRRSWGQERA